MTLVDTNVVAVAVPEIATHLRASAADAQWIISAFFLSFAASLLPAGAVADRHGRRRTFLLGLLGLAAASLLCGLAPTMAWLQLGRGVMGVATAFVLSPALAIIGHRFHGEAERNRAWAIWGGVMGITMVVAPITGGLIVQSFGWRWAFFLNIPICVLLAGAITIYAEESRDTSRDRLDPLGILFFAATMFGLVWGLINVQARGLDSIAALAGFAVGAVALIAFVVAQRVQVHSMLDLALFRSPRFTGAVWAMFAYAATAQVMASLLPIFLQNGGGLSAAAAGLAMLPFAIAMLIFPYVGARLGRSYSPPTILALGLVTVAAGNLMTGWAAFTGGWTGFLVGTFVIGSGAGLLNGETQKVIMMTIPRERAGLASGISTTARFCGILIGFAALNTMFAFGVHMVLKPASFSSVETSAISARIADALISGDLHSALVSSTGEPLGTTLASLRHFQAMAFSASLATAALIAALSAPLVWWLLRRPLSGDVPSAATR